MCGANYIRKRAAFDVPPAPGQDGEGHGGDSHHLWLKLWERPSPPLVIL